MAERERRIAGARDVVEACRKCAIGSTRTHSVYGEGRADARLMLIGEGPGETEDRTGRPFVGRAGELLEKMLAAIELGRDDVFIANTVKCRPTLVENGRTKNRPPTIDEMANCRPYLDEQIDLLRPEIILCLGAPAAKSFLGKNFGISKQRGIWFEGPHGIPLMVTFHPAFILRQTGGSLTEMKRLVWTDLKAVRDRLDAPVPAAAPVAAITADVEAPVPEQSSLF